MAPDDAAPVALLVRLLQRDDTSGMSLSVVAARDDRRLLGASGELVLRFWWESPNLLRASITDVRSGTVAMIQGNGALRELTQRIGLRFERR